MLRFGREDRRKQVAYNYSQATWRFLLSRISISLTNLGNSLDYVPTKEVVSP
jgi:hypothetical protein